MPTQGDRVYSALNATETTETKVGTINIPSAGVKRIVAVYGNIQQPTGTNGEMISGYFRLSFKTVSGTFKFPAAVRAGQGAVAGLLFDKPNFIPVDIPVPPNETVDIYVAADVALTGTGTSECGVVME